MCWHWETIFTFPHFEIFTFYGALYNESHVKGVETKE
jgi:hypothetical protein